MKHKIKVVMLPTENKTDVIEVTMGNLKELRYVPTLLLENLDTDDYRLRSYQHIYITVSQDVEPIKEGDWFLNSRNTLFLADKNYIANPAKEDMSSHRKIIATTDPNLVIECKKETCTRGCSGHYHKCMESKPLPQVQQSFLKEFVANPYGEWEVEHETIHADRAPNGFEHLIKLNQDNTVNITPVKGEIILTRAQLKNILHCATGNVKDFVMHEDRFINDWIKENL